MGGTGSGFEAVELIDTTLDGVLMRGLARPLTLISEGLTLEKGLDTGSAGDLKALNLPAPEENTCLGEELKALGMGFANMTASAGGLNALAATLKEVETSVVLNERTENLGGSADDESKLRCWLGFGDRDRERWRV